MPSSPVMFVKYEQDAPAVIGKADSMLRAGYLMLPAPFLDAFGTLEAVIGPLLALIFVVIHTIQMFSPWSMLVASSLICRQVRKMAGWSGAYLTVLC